MILKKVSFQSLAECGQRFSGRHVSRLIYLTYLFTIIQCIFCYSVYVFLL